MLNLVPIPTRVRQMPGSFLLSGKVVRLGPQRPPGVTEPVRHKLKTLGFSIARDASLPEFAAVFGSPSLKNLNPPARPEGYALRCDSSGVVVRGRDADGLFWGLVTLQQLLNGGRRVPCVEIHDAPAYPFRFHVDDISRKQISRLDDFKEIIRRLSYYKIRYYFPYTEDVLYIKSFPEIGQGRGRLTPPEVRAMHAEARRHNIIIVPSYSLIGHQENLLAHPKFRKYAREVFQLPSAYDVCKPILRPYLRKIIRDVCELFPDSPYFDAGFDEVIGLTEREFMAHVMWCAKEVARYGKRMTMAADMFKDHYGLKKIRRLAHGVIAFEWCYADPREMEAAYRREKMAPMGLSGYNNWCAFLPAFANAKRNIDLWAGVMERWGGRLGFGASQWGDDGYENHRDLCWNLFAYYAEAVWTGRAVRKDFERRFQTTFYGSPQLPLRRIIEDIAPSRKISANQSWQLFRMPWNGLVRLAAVKKDVLKDARHDLGLIRKGLALLKTCLPKRNAPHLEHFRVALERERHVRERLLLARSAVSGLSGPSLAAAVRKMLGDLKSVRAMYVRDWLRNNKRPNIEVSLKVFDEFARSAQEALAHPKAPSGKFLCLDLDKRYDAYVPDVGGVPIGPRSVNGVPFRFADLHHSHADLAPDKPICLQFETCKVRDIHLIYGGQRIVADLEKIKPMVEVVLSRKDKVVFSEKLLSIRHICDWWAPLGEHIWAGGGYRHVDRKRVAYALKPGNKFGLMHLSNFNIRGVQADALRVRLIDKGTQTIGLFAATVETDSEHGLHLRP
ncbi:MAG: hypothetical protein HZA50_14055 [Planctomycetes bacterium]|nr:hypothetical protein [Planctomycetota bacterium]